MHFNFGVSVGRDRPALPSAARVPDSGQRKSVSRPDSRGGWWPIIKESFTGAWQQNVEIKLDSVVSNHAVFACQTLIASDISKLRVKLVKYDEVV